MKGGSAPSGGKEGTVDRDAVNSGSIMVMQSAISANTRSRAKEPGRPEESTGRSGPQHEKRRNFSYRERLNWGRLSIIRRNEGNQKEEKKKRPVEGKGITRSLSFSWVVLSPGTRVKKHRKKKRKREDRWNSRGEKRKGKKSSPKKAGYLFSTWI